MISMAAAICVIFLGFHKLMRIALCRWIEWDVPPLFVLFLTVITAVHFRAELHRRLT
jgi:hypothetical protein